MNRQFLIWELVGAAFIVIVGSALHFAFAWSGYWRPVALIAAVNESVWEHLKLAFWPGLLWSLIEFCIFRSHTSTFWSAKAYGLLVAPTLIVAIFYSYTAVLGRNILVFDIATFVIAIALGQLATAMILSTKAPSVFMRGIGLSLLICQLAAYSTFTFYPPPFSLFEDSRNSTSGIPTGLSSLKLNQH